MRVRTTLTLDAYVVNMVKNMFNGELSHGVNELLKEHLREKNPLEKTFGTFKFKKSTDQMLREGDKEMWHE